MEKGKGDGKGKGGKGGKGKGKGGNSKADPVLDANGKQIACRFFPTGDCKNGNNCGFDHKS